MKETEKERMSFLFFVRVVDHFHRKTNKYREKRMKEMYMSFMLVSITLLAYYSMTFVVFIIALVLIETRERDKSSLSLIYFRIPRDTY